MLQPASRQLFGRDRELAVLLRALGDSEGGRARIVCIGGEPGIGKTRLAEELASAAADRATIAWARCIDPDAAPAYWPWAEAIRALLPTIPRQDLDIPVSCLERIRLVVPDLLDHPATAPAPALKTASDRYQLFDAVRTLFQRASSRAPLVLILDDLHQADAESLLLLEFVARELSDSRVLLVVTYRADEASTGLTGTMGELARVGLQTVALTGLRLEETGQLLRHVSGHRCSDDLVRRVHARTSGNPFFVTEIAHLQSSDGDVIPDNVRAVLQRRLSRLSEPAVQLLTVGSVMGREFDFRIAAAVVPTAATERDLLSALEEGLERLIIEPMPAAGENWYRFRHALVRDTVYESVSPSRRAHWHAAVLELLEQRLGARADEHAVDLAYHATRAETLVGAPRVVKYSRLAGARMMTVHAFDEALGHFERAWRARKDLPCDDEEAGILAGLGLAQAGTTVRWKRQEAWSNIRRAVEYYLEAGEIQKAVAAVTHASLAPEGVTGVAGVIRRLLPLVPKGSREAALLLARGAAAGYFETGSPQAAEQEFSRALGIAASHEDAELELRVLAQSISVDHFALRWDEALAKSRRVLELAGRVDELHSHAYASYRAAFALTHAGRIDEAKGQVQENLAAAERLRDRGLLADALYVEALLDQLRGHWEEARAHSDRGLALAAGHLPLLQARAALEYETGNNVAGGQYVQRLIDADREAQPYPLAGVFTAITLSQIAYITKGMTDTDAARRAARAVMAKSSSVRNAVVSVQMAHALLAVLDEDVDECEADLEALAPSASVMPTQWGLATNRVLGLLAHAVGQERRAWNHFERALAFCRASGFTPELAWTCHDYAAALLDVGARGDKAKAAALLGEGEHLAAATGLEPLRRRIVAFRERYRLRLERNPAGLTTREFEVLQLLANGKSNKEIGEALFISSHTVAVHVARVLAKTGSSNRTAAVAYATRHHLLDSRSATTDKRRPKQ